MAFNVGAAPVGILARALTGNIFVEKSLAYMNEGDKDGYNAYKHDIKNVLRARSTDPSSSISNTSKKQAFKRNLVIVESFETFDPADYHQHWKEFQPSGEFQWEGLPTEVQSTLEELFLGTSAEATEDELTNGTEGLLPGLISQLESNALTVLNGADATPTQVVDNTAIAFRAHGGGSGANLSAPITTSTIFSVLELLIKNQTKAMRRRMNKKFMISHADADIIREAQRLELNFKGVDVTEEGVLRYAGYDLIENPAWPVGAVLFASMSGDIKTDAIQMGTSLSSDFNNVEVARLNNFNRQWGMLLTFAIDIFLVRPEEVCFYTQTSIV